MPKVKLQDRRPCGSGLSLECDIAIPTPTVCMWTYDQNARYEKIFTLVGHIGDTYLYEFTRSIRRPELNVI